MSMHIMYDHQCSKCEAYYIPYDKDIVCPNCGVKEEEIAENIVLTIVSSANYQKKMFGFYTPIAWWQGSFGDYVALLIFKVLDAYEEQAEKNFAEFAQMHFDNTQWGNQLYMKSNIYGLSCRVFEVLDSEDNV